MTSINIINGTGSWTDQNCVWKERWTALICLISAKGSLYSSSPSPSLRHSPGTSPWGHGWTKVKFHFDFYKNCLKNKPSLRLTYRVVLPTAWGCYIWQAAWKNAHLPHHCVTVTYWFGTNHCPVSSPPHSFVPWMECMHFDFCPAPWPLTPSTP